MTDMQKDFIKLCMTTQKELKGRMKKTLKKFGYTPIVGDGYIFGKGDIPILLTAHLDTVHTEVCRDFIVSTVNGKEMLSSPQGIGGDDRCGVYAIIEILKKGLRPYILFCEDEETGGKGSKKFIRTSYLSELSEMKFFIELDRANANDAVFYDCGNEEFQEFILEKTGYEKSYGSFSDISVLSPDTDIASVNLSCGYYKAHTKDEMVCLDELWQTIEVVEKLLRLPMDEVKQYDFKEESYVYSSSNYYYSGRYDSYDSHGSYYNYYHPKYEWKIRFIDKNGELCSETIEAKSSAEALGLLFIKIEYLSYERVISIENLDKYYGWYR